jgi:hypothetical protein
VEDNAGERIGRLARAASAWVNLERFAVREGLSGLRAPFRGAGRVSLPEAEFFHGRRTVRRHELEPLGEGGLGRRAAFAAGEQQGGNGFVFETRAEGIPQLRSRRA